MKKTSTSNLDISPEQMETLVHDFLLNQKTFKDLKGITDKEMEGIYATAYNFYSHGKFDRAEDIFSALCQMDHYKSKYWLGLGASRQMQKKYEKAIDAYGLATLMDINNPLPAFYTAHCLLKLNNKENAIKAFEAVILLCGDKEEHKEVKSQTEQLLEGLKKPSSEQKSK